MADGSTGLGKIITADDKGRDAVHVAVAPVTAAMKLFPGQWCDIVKGEATLAPEGKGAGIVDPFLSMAVYPTQRFWLWMAPGSITSLRHEWSHPALDGMPDDPKAKARAYIESVANQIGRTFESTMDAARRFQESGAELIEWQFEGMGGCDEEFWDHYEVLTGEKAEDRGTFFHCGGCSGPG